MTDTPTQTKAPAGHIEIPGDTLIPDAELARQWGITTRTLARYEAQPNGLPLWIIGGRKFRGERASAEWLAKQVRRPNPTRAA